MGFRTTVWRSLSARMTLVIVTVTCAAVSAIVALDVTALTRHFMLIAVAGGVTGVALSLAILHWMLVRPARALAGTVRDITERKDAEEELRRLVGQQRALAELGQRALAGASAQSLMDDVVVAVARAFDTSHSAVLELLPNDEGLAFRAATGWPPALIADTTMPTGTRSQAGYTLLSNAAVVVEDFRAEKRFSTPPAYHGQSVVSGLSVGIPGSGRPWGVLSVHASEHRHFSADDVHFAEAVANVLAQALAREQTDEALRLSEMRYRLAARATRDAIYDLDMVTSHALWSEGLNLLFGYDVGPEGTTMSWWSDRLHPDDRERVLRRVDSTIAARARSWHADYRFRCGDGSYALVQDRAFVEYRGDGTACRAIGAITDVSEQRRAEDALRRQAAFVKLAREVAVTANEAVSVDDAMSAALRLVCAHTEWPVGHALLLQPAEGVSSPPSLWYFSDQSRFESFRAVSEDTCFQKGVGLVGGVWASGEPTWMTIRHDGEFVRREAALAVGLHGAFACPVLVGTTVVGVLEFFSEETISPPEDLVEAMGGVGTQLGRVIERALAADRLRDYTERLEALSRRVLSAQESERRQVARELHDEIGQALTALKLNLQTLGEAGDAELRRAVLEESLDIADRTLRQTRDLSLNLRPSLLDDLGLVPALRWYLDRQGRRAGFATEFTAAGVDDVVPSEIATACFRIAQEALTNVARHARATKVAMALTARGAALELVVRDTGLGFDTAAASERAGRGESSGLLNMSERAVLVGGELRIDSVVGRGTEVRVRLPLPSSPAEDDPNLSAGGSAA